MWLRIGQPYKISKSSDGEVKSSVRLAGLPISYSDVQYWSGWPRMVSSYENWGFNGNGDGFEGVELSARYGTFIGAGVYVDHANFSPDLAVGFIPDSYYRETYGFVDGLHLIDRSRSEVLYPGLIDGLETRRFDSVSMGCIARIGHCIVCGNDAGSLDQLCDHIRHYKGREVSLPDRPDFRGTIGELNRGVTFFECSVIRTVAADPFAKYMEEALRLGSKILGGWSLQNNVIDRLGSVSGPFIVSPLMPIEKLAELYPSVKNFPIRVAFEGGHGRLYILTEQKLNGFSSYEGMLPTRLLVARTMVAGFNSKPSLIKGIFKGIGKRLSNK